MSQKPMKTIAKVFWTMSYRLTALKQSLFWEATVHPASSHSLPVLDVCMGVKRTSRQERE